MTDYLKVLQAIEDIAGDDFVQSLDAKPTFKKKDCLTLLQKISTIYRIAHSYNTNHSCYAVHSDWRELI